MRPNLPKGIAGMMTLRSFTPRSPNTAKTTATNLHRSAVLCKTCTPALAIFAPGFVCSNIHGFPNLHRGMLCPRSIQPACKYLLTFTQCLLTWCQEHALMCVLVCFSAQVQHLFSVVPAISGLCIQAVLSELWHAVPCWQGSLLHATMPDLPASVFADSTG